LPETEKQGIPISLRPVLLRDSRDIFEAVSHGDLLPAVPGSDQIKSPDDAARVVEGLMERADGGGEFHFSVCLEDGKVVGMCAIYGFMPDCSARIGYWINRDYRGRGYGREVVRRLADVAFSDLGVRKVIAVSKGSNQASIRLLRSLGFAEDGYPGAGSGEKALSLGRDG
jgi:ribosomal-protein-alanine N-acetyltransferase